MKSEFKPPVDNAKRQYMYDRPVKDPITRKPEPILTFKRGALVHFAVSQDQVAMTTKLAGKNTFFLPFNRGAEDGGAGNPMPASENDYATAYLWERDRKSTRLNSSHVAISYAVFCLKKKTHANTH